MRADPERDYGGFWQFPAYTRVAATVTFSVSG